MSLNEAALLLGVSRRTIYNRIRQGRLQVVRTLAGSQRVLIESMRAHNETRRWRPAAASLHLSPSPASSRF